jgi:hypothetical protein
MAPCLKGQIVINRYTSATDTFYYKRYERIPLPAKINLKKISLSGRQQVVEDFMKALGPEYPQYTSDTLSKYSEKDWKKRIFPVDINHDGLTDILFSGFSGGEADITRLYLNRNGQFDLLFEDYQYISSWKMADRKLSSIQVTDPGCCAEYLIFTRDYNILWDDNMPRFVKGKQIVWYQHTELPRSLFSQPVPFIAVSDTLTLRASAAHLDEPYNPVLDNFGNIIAKYRNKCHGIILARKAPQAGNEWFFVEIYPDLMPSASILYGTEKLPTFVRGWVSGRSIIPD